MRRYALGMAALSGLLLLAACGGSAPGGAGTSASTALLEQCAVCNVNPDSYYGCVQSALRPASGDPVPVMCGAALDRFRSTNDV